MGRKTGRKSPGFIDALLSLINSFYGDIVQNIAPWQPPAPKLTRQPEVDEIEGQTRQVRDIGDRSPGYVSGS